MRYRLFGRSGLRVSELGLGTMTFGTDWGWGADEDRAARIVDAFAAAGGNFIDTAKNYTDGSSERIVGELVAEATRPVGARDEVHADDRPRRPQRRRQPPQEPRAVARAEPAPARAPTTSTCCGCTCATRRRRSRRRCARSTTRCGSARCSTSGSPTRRRGWWRRPTRSPSCAAGRRSSALQLAVQPRVARPERELLPMAAALGLDRDAVGRARAGVLTGRPAHDAPLARGDDGPGAGAWSSSSPASPRIAAARRRRSRSPGCSDVARRSSCRSSACGAREQLADNLGALDVELTEIERARLDEAAPPSLGFPRSFLESDGVRDLIYGDTWNLLYSDGARALDATTAG